MLILPEQWKELWRGSDPFEQVFALQGEEFRNMDGRRTLRFELLGRSYFVKMYRGLGWGRILRSLLSFRRPPVLSAYNEWLAIQVLSKLGVETMTIVGYGEEGRSPASRRSFLITEDLRSTESLEDFCRNWPQNPPPVRLKRALIRRLAEVSRLLHDHGINHRDYYLCHFLLDVAAGREQVDADHFHLHLIDLHRVQFRKRVPRRWRIKDLASLYFSALEIGLTRRDCYRFMKEYQQQPLREIVGDRLWSTIVEKAKKLQQRFYRKYA
ncbi:MAG: lipopolysaccharide core heptose(I) kinase RfaP [Desulfuromonadaceae bacterium]|nr:lipopolysaccharide core heptose(I) kinase RfaP [Desulfuromonadaceae bacterium]